jgi:hypothetical protein
LGTKLNLFRFGKLNLIFIPSNMKAHASEEKVITFRGIKRPGREADHASPSILWLRMRVATPPFLQLLPHGVLFNSARDTFLWSGT